jgi:hypothetical protein
MYRDRGTDLSIPRKLKEELNIRVELFGSALNTLTPYCSINYDVEKPFGSLGPFQQFDDYRGVLLANPPFWDDLFLLMFEKFYEKRNEKFSVFMTLPIWDNEFYEVEGIMKDK